MVYCGICQLSCGKATRYGSFLKDRIVVLHAGPSGLGKKGEYCYLLIRDADGLAKRESVAHGVGRMGQHRPETEPRRVLI